MGLLFLGGVCVAASEFYKSRYNVILCAGILFVSAGQTLMFNNMFFVQHFGGVFVTVFNAPKRQNSLHSTLKNMVPFEVELG